jgi:Carbohydrate-binding family 9
MLYLVHKARAIPALNENWHSPAWQDAEVLNVAHFRPESSEHRPVTQAKVLHDDAAIYVFFHVADRYVRSVQTQHNGPVCTDSCVEWFARPRPDRGYINFEVNCGGTLHCSYIEDPTRVPGGFKRFTPVPQDLTAQIHIVHSLPSVVEPEITDAVEWTVAYRVPVALFEHYVGKLGALSGQQWMANFYKCGDQTSHPHWAAWSPVHELNFHRLQDFAPIQFE